MKSPGEIRRGEGARRKLWLSFLVLALYVLHQDYWFWSAATPLVLGFLPVGLFYHVCFTVAASLLMALLVKWAWPAHLEHPESFGGFEPPEKPGRQAPGGDAAPSAGEG